MTRFARVFIPLLILTAIGCTNPADDKDEDLDVETKSWDVVDNAYQFYTNDVENFNYSFWYRFSNEVPGVFTTMTGVAKKVSGAKDQGYGFLFCANDSGDYYRVLITTTGFYSVVKRIADVPTTIKDWSESSALVQGYNKENTIKVTRNASAVFSIEFNNVVVYQFTATDLDEDSFAAVATVGDEEVESFPNTPEDLRFRFTAPSVLPAASKAMTTPSVLPASSPSDAQTRIRL